MMDDKQLLHAYARERYDAKDPRLGLDRTRQLPSRARLQRQACGSRVSRYDSGR